ncbi:MAG TPA: MBL fold metallo-hydrolase, partial [Bryobacteraceae bacterium]|nr:MBL fold metallo-hydrolase [Bryobacteraceae bacterium]
MSRTLLTRFSAGALFLTLAWIAYTQLGYTQNPPPAKLTVNKVKDDLYEIVGDGGNVAVYITNEGVILIDDKFDQDHEGIVDGVKSVTNQPIKYIINTHYHADHSGGNTKFLPAAEIISTAMARTNILEHKQSNAPAGVSPARIT